MQTLYALYLQNPFWVWLAVGAMFVALDLATGTGKLIWLGFAAAVVALLDLTNLRLGLPVELGVFAALSVLGVALSFTARRRPPRPAFDNDRAAQGRSVHNRAARLKPALPDPAASGGQDRAGRLIGRIGRTSSEFVNGVGRVWIDGAEWGAEIDAGADVMAVDTPVRVTGVTGGVRLYVRDLMG